MCADMARHAFVESFYEAIDAGDREAVERCLVRADFTYVSREHRGLGLEGWLRRVWPGYEAGGRHLIRHTYEGRWDTMVVVYERDGDPVARNTEVLTMYSLAISGIELFEGRRIDRAGDRAIIEAALRGERTERPANLVLWELARIDDEVRLIEELCVAVAERAPDPKLRDIALVALGTQLARRHRIGDHAVGLVLRAARDPEVLARSPEIAQAARDLWYFIGR